VVQTDGRTFLRRIGDDHVRVSSDRVTRAPTPDGTLGGEAPRNESQATSRANPRNADNGTSTDEGQQQGADEYVFERIVGTR
jgi:hypothetical protein